MPTMQGKSVAIHVPGTFVPVLRAEAREQITLDAELREREPAADSEQAEADAQHTRAWRSVLAALEDDGTLRDREIPADRSTVEHVRDVLRENTRGRLSDVLAEETGPARSWVPAALDGWCVVMDQFEGLEGGS